MTDKRAGVSESFFQAVYELGKHLEQDLRLDEDGSCSLLFQDKWPLLIQCVPDEHRALVSVLVSDPATRHTDGELLALAEYGWLGLQTRGIALSPDRERGALLGWRPLTVDKASGDTLRLEIESFLADCEDLRARLPSVTQESTDGSGLPPQLPVFDTLNRYA